MHALYSIWIISDPFMVQKKKENPPLSYNEIRSLPKSRLIGHDGKNIGEFQGEEILRRAASKGFDVYQVSEIPPVVRFAEHVLKPEVKKVKSKVWDLQFNSIQEDLNLIVISLRKFVFGMSYRNMI